MLSQRVFYAVLNGTPSCPYATMTSLIRHYGQAIKIEADKASAEWTNSYVVMFVLDLDFSSRRGLTNCYFVTMPSVWELIQKMDFPHLRNTPAEIEDPKAILAFFIRHGHRV